MDGTLPSTLRATCDGCGEARDVVDLFSFDCTCPACGGMLVLDGGGEGEDGDGSPADVDADGFHDEPTRDGSDLGEALFQAESLYDQPTKADTEDPYALAAQALDSSVAAPRPAAATGATTRLATSRRTTQALTTYDEDDLVAPDAGPAADAPPRPLLQGTAPDAPPLPTWDDTGKAPGGDEAAPLDGLVEVVEVPAGGTAGRGSRTYERDDVIGGGRAPERLPTGRHARPDGPLFGGQDHDWLALIDDHLPEGEGDGDGKPRVVIRLPEAAAPTDAADSDRVRQFEQAIKNLEAGGPGAIDGLLGTGPVEAPGRAARRYDGGSTQPIGGASTQPLKKEGEQPQEEDTRSWGDAAAKPPARPASARSEQVTASEGVPRPRGPKTVDSFRHDDLDPALVCARDASSPQADRFRQLVQRVFHPVEGAPPRVVLVTSPRPGDGKTTVAANLAIAAAGRLGGRGAVLVDADPRGRGVLHRFGVRVRSEGLLEALRAGGPPPDPRDVVMQFSLGNLDVVPLGIPGSDAAELLASDRCTAFLGRLRDAYPGAAIIVDASSVLHAADPLVLARGVDGVVLVARADRTARDDVRRALELLGPPRVLGLVLNDAAA
ncbi:MAG: CpsD/CapB family tyrosine-protein kinase [Planctomycetes bacterium]|nr:CpsD/CapB family tyrosine-protein kinase [Planctomycetota bacterium]